MSHDLHAPSVSVSTTTPQERLHTLQRLGRLGISRHELMADIVDVVEHDLLEFELSPSIATLVANAVADRLADYWGGQTLSFPRDFYWRVNKRSLALYQMSTGNNIEQLVQESGMTRKGVQICLNRINAKIVMQAKAEAIPGQLDMFHKTPTETTEPPPKSSQSQS